MATAAQVAQEVKNQGGSDQQAWVAAALVSGIESNGQPTDKNPTSTACGLFQFLTTTWISNGGGKYAPNACAATWQQQVSVFLTASQGNNFYPWAPDLGGSYNGKPIYGPDPGSKVGNKISQLSAGGTLSFLGNVPTAWIGAATGGTGATTPTTGLGSLLPGGGSTAPGNSCTPVLSGLSVTILNSCQADELLGGVLIAVGGLFFILGLGVILADVGLTKSAPAIVGGIIGRASAPKIPKDDGATKAARKTYNAQQAEGYKQAKSTRASAPGPGRSRPVHRVPSSPTPDF